MKAIRMSFLQMLLFVRRDMMLFAACFAPLLAGLVFRFVIPLLEKVFAVISLYYGIFDLFYSMIAPTMFCFAAAMVILEEHDDRIENYLFITGLGKTGYFISRIFVPAGFALILTLALLPVFKLTPLSAAAIIFLAITGTLQGIIIALLIVTLSANKLEGLAITKVSSLTILGAFVPYFVPGKIQYLLAFLPSFWSGKAVYEQNLLYMLPSLLLAGIWIFILLNKTKAKLA